MFTGASAALSVPWVDGDFLIDDLGLLWYAGPGASIVDADGDGDLEGFLHGVDGATCPGGDGGNIRFARGLDMPATSGRFKLEFDVEDGGLQYWSFRMIMLSATHPEAELNNLMPWVDIDGDGANDNPLYSDSQWFDDHVLAWESTSTILGEGHHVFDPTQAYGYGIPNWNTMSPAQRNLQLLTYDHLTLVIYSTCLVPGDTGGATLDNFAWVVPGV